MFPTSAKSLGFLSLSVFASSALAASNSTNSTTNSTSTVGLLSSGLVDLGDWSDAYTKAKALVAQLTNEEKISIITGGDATSVNYTALKYLDGTQGPQGYNFATGFSQGSAIAMTWDKDLIYKQFYAVAEEFKGKGINVANSPTTGPLGRTPYGGRLVESVGTDPYLNGVALGLGVSAFNDVGVIPGVKHYILNEQETNRMAERADSSVAPYSSDVDDKTLHETYLWPWYDGAKSGMGAVMCAMTKVNSTMSCESEHMNMQILKTELGFPGQMYPDVGGQSTAFGSANGGEDYGSSSIWSSETVLAGINNGSLTQARLDDMAIRNVIPFYYTGQDAGYPSYSSTDDYVDVRGNHSAIVRENGAASLVLLKNTNNALPLSSPRIMALFGSGAGPIMAGPNNQFQLTNTPQIYEGHLAGGTGSEQTSFPYLITPQQALTYRASQDGTMIRWILNNTYTSTSSGQSFGVGGSGTELTQTIPDYATSADVCLVFINALSGEGTDRSELSNTEQDSLVTSVASSCNNTIVVVNTVGPRVLDAWATNDNVTAIVYGGLLGQESGNSIMDVLYGDVNPSGRLTYTIAKSADDYNVDICTTAVCNFTEGNYIDYKYFDKYNVTPRYEFGYGLSYTTFTYSNVTVEVTDESALSSAYPTGKLSVGGYADLWDEVVSVSVLVANTGAVDGYEVAQLYISFPEESEMPVRVLRGFERVQVGRGQSERVAFSVKRRDLSYWDVGRQQWKVASGRYGFAVGASSRDIRGVVEVEV